MSISFDKTEGSKRIRSHRVASSSNAYRGVLFLVIEDKEDVIRSRAESIILTLRTAKELSEYLRQAVEEVESEEAARVKVLVVPMEEFLARVSDGGTPTFLRDMPSDARLTDMYRYGAGETALVIHSSGFPIATGEEEPIIWKGGSVVNAGE